MALLISVLGYQVRATGVDEHMYFSMLDAWREIVQERGPSALPEYRVTIEARRLDVGRNLSGLAYDDGRDQLWAVVNDPPELLALDRKGEILARHPLNGFQDVEGVAYLGDDLLLLVEERRYALVVVPVPKAPGPIVRAEHGALTLPAADDENEGLEGAGYDRKADRLFVVKEHSPRKLYEVHGLRRSRSAAPDIRIVDRDEWIRGTNIASDYSSVEYLAQSGHLALLSDESALIVELDRDGRVVGERRLLGGFSGLHEAIPQAEGMAFDDAGRLYVVSEPNLFYAFSPVPGRLASIAPKP